MKTRNSWIFVLTAFFCGVLFCTSVSAKVCFVGDPNCAGGSEFGEYEDPNKDNTLCKQEGYVWDTETQGKCANIGGVCPYDARYVKCCGAEYAYQACVYPLETVKNEAGKIDKCGNLYKCQCGSDYKTPDEWEKETSGSCAADDDKTCTSCQPGGGICIMSTTDEVRYDKCTCDTNFFPYTKEAGCPENAVVISSCTDSDRKTHYRCQCPSYFHTCTYGKAPDAQTCVENGVEKYSSCKEAGAECENQGYFKDCQTKTCYHDTNSTIEDKRTYPAKCEDSYEACEYAYGYYKCRWSAANYCAAKHPEMTNYAKDIPTSCTKDGVQGTVVPCYLGSSTKKEDYLGYYRCKLTCEQQVRGAFSQGYLTVDNNIIDDKGNYGFVRTDSRGRHLYLIDNITFPKERITDRVVEWNHTYAAKENYVSVNGINALYDIDSTRYSTCAEKRSYSYRPTMTIDLDKLFYFSPNRKQEIYWLDVDLSDINIAFKFPSITEIPVTLRKNYILRSNHTWKNVAFRETGETPPEAHVDTHLGQRFIGNGSISKRGRSLIHLNSKVQLVLTGDISFYPKEWCFKDYHDEFDSSCGGCTSWTQFHTDSRALVHFLNANIYTSYYWDWDGASDSTMLFENSNGNMGKVWSHWSVGLLNSKISMRMLRVDIGSQSGAKESFGGSYNSSGIAETGGIYVGKNSTLTVTDYWTLMQGVRAKLYIAPGSTFKTIWPFALRGDDEVICIPNDSTSKFIACDGRSSKCYTNRENANSSHRDTGFSRYFLYRGAGGGNTCFPPAGDKYKTQCDYNTVKNNFYKGGSYSSGNWTSVGSSGGYLMSGCGYMEKYGMGYNF